MDDRERVIEVSEHIATAIAQRDVRAIRALLAPDFVHRTIGAEATDVETFLRAIEEIHGEIVFIRLDELQIDLSGTGALVTGMQHAQVRVDGQVVDDRRPFVDWFVKDAGEWRIRVAVDLPGAA